MSKIVRPDGQPATPQRPPDRCITIKCWDTEDGLFWAFDGARNLVNPVMVAAFIASAASQAINQISDTIHATALARMASKGGGRNGSPRR